jgi:hypothetical protein
MGVKTTMYPNQNHQGQIHISRLKVVGMNRENAGTPERILGANRYEMPSLQCTYQNSRIIHISR